MVDWDGFQNTLDFSWIRISCNQTGILLRGSLLGCPELDPVWMVVSMNVLLNFLKPPEKIVTSVLETQSSTWALVYLSVYYWTDRVIDCFCLLFILTFILCLKIRQMKAIALDLLEMTINITNHSFEILSRNLKRVTVTGVMLTW